jgi:integrase/recombinase XerD
VGQGHGARGMIDDAVRLKLKFLTGDVDRHGNARFYVRVPGRPKVRIRGVPGSEEFMAAYAAAIEGKPKARPRIAVRGSFRHLCQLYFASLDFRQLDVATQTWRRRTLEAISQQYGEGPVAQLEGRHVRRIVEERADRPSAAKKRLRAMQALFKWALAANEVSKNPTRDVAPVRYLEKGHHTWTLDEVGAFEARHPAGTKARLAMALLLYTACRREDVVRLGPQNVRGNRVRFVQAKNEHRNPVAIDIPLHADLSAAIEAAPSGHLNFLVTAFGKPFTPPGFGNWFRDRCDEAGLKHCSAHGLRKATAARLAERGATPHEIMAVTGHRSLDEVERYTKEAQRAGLADSAMAKLKRGT